MAAKMSRGKNLEVDKSVSMGSPQTEVAEHERQFLELLAYCPAALSVVDDAGLLLFHNARLRELLGYDEEEMRLFDTRRCWDDLDAPSQDHQSPPGAGWSGAERGSNLEDEIGPADQRSDLVSAGCISRRPYQFHRRQESFVGLRCHRAAAAGSGTRRPRAAVPGNPRTLPRRAQRG